MKIVTAAQMREIDRRAETSGLSTQALMENAGRAVAREVRGWLGRVAGVRMLAMVGPGNNGGDGLVAARHLHDWGADIIIYLLAPRSHDDRNLALLRERRIPILTADQDPALEQFSETLSRASVVMDAILGTGRSRPLSGIFKEALERVGEEKARRRALQVVAVDLPTGLNADTGDLDPACVLADLTVTLAFPKLGFYSGSAASALGELKIADIGIPEDLAQDVPTELITPQLAAALLPHRPLDSNKGTFGRVMVVAGSINYIGAAALSCVAAGRAGAGLVTLAVPRSLLPIMAAKLTEATFLPLPESQTGHLAAESTQELLEQLPGYNAVLLGCGIGQHEETRQFVSGVLPRLGQGALKAVIDADGLNIIADFHAWWDTLGDESVLTPHPGEMARLIGGATAQVQEDRLGVVRRASGEWRKTVVLKGAHTVVAFPDGRARISPFANPALATAGTGDVLAGIIAGLLAQGLTPYDAATCGVYIQAAAGKRVREALGDAGTQAGDLLLEIPRVMKELNHFH